MAVLAFFAGPIGRWLVVAALVAAAVFAAAMHERNIGWNKRDQQAKVEQEAQRKANASAVTALDAKYRASEKAKQEDVNKIGETHAADTKRIKDQAARDVAAARAGRSGLSIPSPCNTDGSAPAKAGDGAPGEAGPGRIGLSPEVSGFLLGEANAANQIVSDLNECRSILRSERQP